MNKTNKYQIGICYTKQDAVGIGACNAFIKGVIESGDIPIPIRSIEEFMQYSICIRCDAFVQVCDYTKHLGKDLRFRIKKYCKNNDIPRIVIDTGFLKNNRTSMSLDRYMEVGIGGIKNHAIYFNEDSPSDRWDKLDIELEPWRDKGEHILVLGQFEKGVSVQDIDVVEWMGDTIKQLQSITDREVRLRSHPNQTMIPPGTYSLSSNRLISTPIEEDLEDCWCVVALTTNGAVNAIVEGIPVITNNTMNMAYNVSGHKLEEVENPPTFDRAQWAYDLAYAQWHIDEIKEGLAWRHFRKNLFENDCSNNTIKK